MQIEAGNGLRLKLLSTDELKAWQAPNIPKSMIARHIQKIEDGADPIFNSFWLIMRECDDREIGSLGFKGGPDENGFIEIGYGLDDAQYEGMGYATRAVQALCLLAKDKALAKCIIAETEPNNAKSEKLLERLGFEQYKKVQENKWWKMEL